MSGATHAINGAATWEASVRGLMIGLAMGDAIGSKASEIPTSGPLLAGAASQLAAFTMEALIRADGRLQREGQQNQVWMFKEAYLRWAAVQGYQPEKLKTHSRWYSQREGEVISPGGVGWPDGWLSRVPAMKERRGTSPSTVKSLLAGAPIQSSGCQGLLRVLPIAAWRTVTVETTEDYAYCAAALTHSRVDGNAPIAVTNLRACLDSDAMPGRLVKPRGLEGDSPGWTFLAQKLPEIVATTPCVPDVLKKLAPDRSAASALCGGLYVALSFPDADTVMEALEFAAWAPDGDSVAAIAGAFLGAVHGVDAFPIELVSRLELGWVMDTLARDLALTLRENQAGTPKQAPVNPRWATAYPPY